MSDPQPPYPPPNPQPPQRPFVPPPLPPRNPNPQPQWNPPQQQWNPPPPAAVSDPYLEDAPKPPPAKPNLAGLIIGQWIQVLIFAGAAAAMFHPWVQDFYANMIIDEMKKSDPKTAGEIIKDTETFNFVIRIFSSFMAGWMGIHAILTAIAAYYLAKCRGRVYIVIVGALNALMFPIGTPIGLWSVVVLSKADVKAYFERPKV